LQRQTESTSALRAVLIADIRGYTPYTTEHGDAASRELVERFQVRVREAVADRALELQFQKGDEVLGVFESARSALRSAVDMRQRFRQDSGTDDYVPIGIGLSSGEIVRRDGNYEGTPLILASRLCSIAGPGEAYADERIVDGAGPTDHVRAVLLGPRYLKGRVDPIQLYTVVGDEEEVERSWLDRVLDAMASYQESNDRNFRTGIPTLGHNLQRILEVDSKSESGIAMLDAVQEALDSELIVERGSRNLRLTPTGWRVARGRIPGSDRDADFVQAVVDAWRDPNVIRRQSNWISMEDVFARMNLPWDIYAGLNATERLQYSGLVISYEAGQNVWVRPTGRALISSEERVQDSP
jgi:class 3 adenylate cyclase